MNNQTKIKVKLRAMELEKDNFDKLIIFDSTNGFAKIGGNSAIFYAGNIAKRIGRRFLLRNDDDHYGKSEVGIISVKYNEDLIQRLEAIDVKLDPEAEEENIHIFRFKNPFSRRELEFYREQIFQERREIDKIVLPKSPIPTLFMELKELNEICYYNFKDIPELGRRVIGEEIFRLADELLEVYIRGANEGFRGKEMLKMMKLLGSVKYKMKNVEILRLIPARNIVRILEKGVKIEQILAKILKTTGMK